MYATATRTRVLARGLAALVGALLILLGIPTALWIFGGGLPLPTSLPTLSSIWGALSRPDDGTLLLGILRVAGWLGWASYALPLLVELVTRLAGLKAPALPALRLQQRQVAALAAAIAALVSTAGAATAAPQAPRPPTISTAGYDTAHAVAEASAPQRPADAARAASPATELAPKAERGSKVKVAQFVDQPGRRPFMRVVVEKGDTLWEIAEEELGDGAKWPSIAKASASISQDDGRRLIDPDLIYPGWDLDVPRPATTSKKSTTAPPATTPPARDNAPDSSSTPSTSTATSSAGEKADTRRQPEELEQTGRAEQPPAPTQAPSSTPSVTSPPTTAPSTAQAPATSAPQMPTPSAPPTQAPAPAATPEASAPPSTPGAAHHEAMLAQSDSPRRVATVAGLGSLAAAGLLTFLWLRRARQQRHRRPGQRTPLPAGQAAIAEAQLRVAADPVAVEDLDRALRTLAGNARALGEPLPALRAARVAHDAIELYLVDETATLPKPFTPLAGSPGTWTLHRRHLEVLLSAEEADEITPPFPTLVSVGVDDEKAHLLLNLEELGAFGLTGDPELCHEVLVALTIELITSAWTDDSRITLVGLMPELVHVLGSDRATYCDELEDAYAALTYAADVHRQALQHADLTSATDARVAGVHDSTWTPHLVLVSQHMSLQDQERLRAIVETIPRVAVAAITAGTEPVGPWHMHIDRVDDTTLVGDLHPVPLRVTPQHLSLEDYEHHMALFRACDAAPVDGPAWADDITDAPIDLDQIPVVPDSPATVDEEDLVDDAPVDELQEARPEEDDLEETAAGDETAVAAALEDQAPTAPLEALTDADVDELPAAAVAVGEEQPDPGQTLTDVTPAAAPVLRLLGPLEVRNATGPRPQSPGRALEIVAYLALHPGSNEHAFSAAIFPGERADGGKLGAKRNTYMRAARRWLGEAPDGHPYVGLVPDVGYRLAEDMPIDWAIFTDLIGPSIHRADTSSLRTALGLVDGRPMSGIDASRYAWAQTDISEMIAAIADVAHELATRAITAGDVRTAVWAAEKGLDVEPVSEALWRDRITAAYQAGDLDAVISRYHHVLDTINADPDPETQDLINEVTGRTRTTQPAHA